MAEPALWERARHTVIPVTSFTDEELYGLSPGDTGIGMPSLFALDSAQREQRATGAIRSLVGRGIVRVADGQYHLPPWIGSLLAARIVGTPLVMERVATPNVASSRVVVLLPELGVAVDDEVGSGGMHAFYAGPIGAMLERAVEYVDPLNRSGGDSVPECRMNTEEVIAGKVGPMKDAKVVAVVKGRDPHIFYAHPTALWVSRPDPDDEQSVLVRTLGKDEVLPLLQGAVPQ